MKTKRTTLSDIITLALVAGLLLLSGNAGAHPATEKYIPIGYWDKVSRAKPLHGPVSRAASISGDSLTMKSNGRTHPISIDKYTKIWIDRSQQGKTSIEGTIADCAPGTEIEVRMKNDGSGVAKWIKVRGHD